MREPYRYSPGDKVLIREDLVYRRYYMESGAEFGKEPECDSITTDMLQYMGETACIERCIYGKYKIDLDHGLYNWVDEMFLGLASDDCDFGVSDMPIETLLGK